MRHQSHVIATFGNHADADKAVLELMHSDFEDNQISIVGRCFHTEEGVTGFYEMGDRVKAWSKAGAFWGAAWGWLLGVGVFFVPGLGTVMMGGPVLALLISTVEGSVVVGGLSALGATLYSLGIPKHTVLATELAIKADRYVVMVHGSADDVERARQALHHNGAEQAGPMVHGLEEVHA